MAVNEQMLTEKVKTMVSDYIIMNLVVGHVDWVTGIQNALDYIEENLTNDLDYEAIAKRAHVSSYYFQKVFSILCGYSVGEYIRNRKLTLAANDILISDLTIIDIGLKYGYQTHESFTRAYKRFHGVTPTETRKQGTSVNSCSRLTVKMIVEGGSIMNYKIVEKESFVMIGKGVSVDVSDKPEQIVSAFWTECEENGVWEELESMAASNQDFSQAFVGIADASTFKDGKYTYYISVPYNGKTIPKGYEIRTVSAQIWAVFKYLCQDKAVNIIMEMLKKIFTEFFPTSSYQPMESYQLEIYPMKDVKMYNYIGEIWIAVEEK